MTTTKRELAAQVMLQHRLNNLLHISDTTEIDICYISCAEYQLFIDEKLKQGEYHQPDHWVSTTFPKGSGAKPVTGMRSSDAKTFCDWLTAREAAYQYRLPSPKEVEQNSIQRPIKPSLMHALFSKEVGTWCQSNPSSVFGVSVKPKLIYPSFVISNLDGARDLDFDLAFARARARDFARDLSRDLDFARDLDLDLVPAHAPEQSRSFNLALAQNLDRDLIRIHNNTREHNLFLIRLSWVEMFQYLSAIYDQNSDKKTIESILRELLQVFVSLAILDQRIHGNLPAWEGIRIVRERIA